MLEEGREKGCTDCRQGGEEHEFFSVERVEREGDNRGRGEEDGEVRE